MSEEGKDLQFLCFDIYFFPLVVDCFVFGLEIWGYVLPLCPPMQTHQRLIGFHGAPSPCGISVPSICYFKLFGFLRWVNKFGLSRKKPQQNTQANFSPVSWEASLLEKSENSQNIMRKNSACYFLGKKGARSASFTEGGSMLVLCFHFGFVTTSGRT